VGEGEGEGEPLILIPLLSKIRINGKVDLSEQKGIS
jgi:hypothetical protein